MPFYIHKPYAPKKTFVLNRTLHLTADGRVVEADDPAGKRNLGMRGSSLYEEEAKAYGLDDSHRLIVEAPKPEPAPEPVSEPEPQPAPQPAPAPIDDELPEDFPGRKALVEAGITTLEQVRALENVQDIPGIGEATAAKIAEALAK